jgi:cell division protein FtsB
MGVVYEIKYQCPSFGGEILIFPCQTTGNITFLLIEENYRCPRNQKVQGHCFLPSMQVVRSLVTLLCLLLACCSETNETGDGNLGTEPFTAEELLHTLALVTAEKESLQLENAEIKKRQTQLEKNIEHLTKKSSYILELGKLEDKYAQLVTETSMKTAMFTDTIARLESELTTEKEKSMRSLAEQSITAHNGVSVSEMKQQIAALEQQIQHMQANADTSTAVIADLEGKQTELRNMLARITQERDQLHLDLRSAGGAVTKAQKDTHIMKDRYLTAARRLDEQSVTIQELERHHDKCRELAQQQEATIAALQKNVASLTPSPATAVVTAPSASSPTGNAGTLVRHALGDPLKVLLKSLAQFKQFLLRFFRLKR